MVVGEVAARLPIWLTTTSVQMYASIAELVRRLVCRQVDHQVLEPLAV